ncbi:hypothetical protein FACS1894199_16860 [Bacteroidia bacterium]|nr:hypothetical protein FACS1894199_16860 [Bacteroidia bacterium]
MKNLKYEKFKINIQTVSLLSALCADRFFTISGKIAKHPENELFFAFGRTIA